MKTCKTCKRELPLGRFYAHKGMKDGHINKCIDCVATYDRRRRVPARTKFNLQRWRF